uniref:Uncharacterized protein n=1 Tax=Kalmanozyma brasiliensis (strain GHG001) TaxID=1365824 RepID=V5GTT2_KALBG
MKFVDLGDHIKITLSIDWFTPFKGRYSGWHSSGAILMRIDNIPKNTISLDRKCAGIHLVGLLPGPKEQDVKMLTPFLQLITDELKMLYRDGIRIKTARHPEGRELKVKLGMIVADSPARAKVGGLLGQRFKGKGCPYCLFDMDELGSKHASSASKRTAAHREHSLACRSAAGARQHRSNGVQFSVLHELVYFSTPTMCPPDYMHAVHLGMCKRFFHKFLIEGCNNIGGMLGPLLAVVNNTSLPSSATRPDGRIGKPGGGNPNAEQWLTFFKHQLIFGLIQVWSQSLGGAGMLQLQFNLEPKQISGRRPVLLGSKAVEDVFEAALLLSAIVDFMERPLSDGEVSRLEELIVRFNRQQSNMLGPGWLTYNNHIAKHIPEFIRLYGVPKNFSCYAFESYNGVLGGMKKCNRKGGVVEDSMMRTTSLRSEVDRVLLNCGSEMMKKELTRYIRGSQAEMDSITETKAAKKVMDGSTTNKLLFFLNGPHKTIRGVYQLDGEQGPDDVGITTHAQHFHTLTRQSFPRPIRYSSALQGGSVNLGNTYVLVPLPSSQSLVAQILWLFKKRIRFNTDGEAGEDIYFAHVRSIEMVEAVDALGAGHPGLDLMDEIGLMFARPGEGGTEMVHIRMDLGLGLGRAASVMYKV